MDPTIWGPHLWFYMHTLSFNYPVYPNDNDKKDYYNFFLNLTKILPCIKCKTHFKDFFDKNPIEPYLINRDKLIEWVMNAHNNVNKLNNKTEWTLDDVFTHYQNIFLNTNTYILKNNMKNIIIVLLILIILYFITKKNT